MTRAPLLVTRARRQDFVNGNLFARISRASGNLKPETSKVTMAAGTVRKHQNTHSHWKLASFSL